MRSDFKAGRDAAPSRRSVYILLVVSLAAAFNYYDRYLLAILIEPIKRDLGLSDSQIGLLSGFAFAAVYCSVAVPIARVADRGMRVRVLSLSLALWSGMTALTGAAGSYATLLLCRLGVAVGESGGLPSTHAIVVESVSKERRATALSVVAFISAAGVSAAMIFGGLIADTYGWRAAFVIAGVPGLGLALLIWLSVAEPRRGLRTDGTAAEPVSFGTALKLLWQRKSFVYFCTGTAFGMISVFAFQIWVPAFLMRNFGLSAHEVSSSYSVLFTVGNLGSAVLGGILYDFLVRRDSRWSFWLQAISYAAALPLGWLFLYAPSYIFLLVLTPFMVLVTSLYGTPAYTLAQTLSGTRLRSTGAAIFMLVANLIGFGLGPTIVGVLSDALAPWAGNDSLQHALALTSISGPVAALLFLKGATMARRDFELVERDDAELRSVVV